MSKGINLNNLDTTVKPSNDFYQFANGGWIKNNPIPPSEYRWGAFNELEKNNEALLKEILEDIGARQDLEEGSDLQKLRDFYLSGMNEDRIEQQGLTYMQDKLDRIAAIQTVEDLATAQAYLYKQGVQTLWAPYIVVDEKNTGQYVFRLHQGGFGLPDRDYYLKDDSALAETRAKYQQHISNMFGLLGHDPATSQKLKDAVWNIEYSMAQSAATSAELNDYASLYNKVSIAELQTLVVNVDWQAYLKELGVSVEHIVVSVPKFMQKIDSLMSSVPLDEWKAYMTWHLIATLAPFLGKQFVEESFAFYGKAMTGAEELRPRWKRVTRTIDTLMGEILGKEFVGRHFKPEAKQRLNDMVDQLIAVFNDRIDRLDWMTKATKIKAKEKLHAFGRKLGYPDVWRDYTKLEIKNDAYVLNVFRAAEFEWYRNASQLGKRVDRTEWYMTPPSVNAYNDFTMNEIAFPAGILQPPFFDPEADDAVNYGAIGVVIGHELTHGFDYNGRKYSAKGEIENWWTDEDAERFTEKSNVIMEQFNSFEALPGLHVNGQLTIGEDIADLGGLSISFEALQRTLAGKEREVIDGYTPAQRFFLGFASVWRSNTKPEGLRKQVLSDPHSPSRFRVIGPLSNIQEFYDAFNVQPGDAMYRDPATRAKIW